ncbi:MAG TPA: sulfite exporter TauE/SafE family protein [Ramlibacter sp.]|nr:sulfite exporter TauE/SafE family protein [Ramlibacter sp.]
MMAASVVGAFSAIAPGLAAYSLGVVFLGYVVLGLSGFGSALTIVPLLALRWPLVTVVPVVLLTDVCSGFLLARLNMRAIRWGELGALLPGIVVGAAVGAWAARWTSEPLALAVLAAYVIAVALRRARGIPPAQPRGLLWAALAGGLAGIVESLYGTSGPVLVAWLSRRLNEPMELRATVPPALVTVTGCALIGMAVSGQLAQPIVWGTFPVMFCVGLAGTAIGHRVAMRLPAAWIARVILALLLFAGAAMALHAWQMQALR